MATPDLAPEPIRVAAGCTFLNASDVLPTTLANLVRQGITDIYLADHANAVATWPAIQSRLGSTAKLHVIHKDSAPFYQGAMMTIMMHLARRDGADAFLPLDADEFPDADDGAQLLDEIGRWLRNDSTEGLRVPIVNYLQARHVTSFEEAHLADATWRVLPSGRPQDGGKPEGERRPFLERLARAKTIVRLSGLADPDAVWIGEGNHEAYREGLPTTTILSSVSTRLVIRHLPVRSRAVLEWRREHARRRSLMGRSDNRLTPAEVRPPADLEHEWRACSVPPEGPDEAVTDRLRLVPDDDLARLARQLPPVPGRDGVEPGSIIEIGAREIFTVASDVLGRHLFISAGSGGRPEGARPTARTREPDAPKAPADVRALRKLRAQAEEARSRAREAEQRVADIERSSSWRLTAPLRAVRSRFRRA
jgi:hypothetical protein